MSTLSSYLQCLYSIPTWRNTILGWRAPPTSRDDELLVDVEMGTDDEESFEGVWKGDSGMNGAGFGGGGGGGGNEEEMRIFRTFPFSLSLFLSLLRPCTNRED